jgi:hypothetical protein
MYLSWRALHAALGCTGTAPQRGIRINDCGVALDRSSGSKSVFFLKRGTGGILQRHACQVWRT